MKTLLSARGQIVIPKKIRNSIKLKKGDEFEINISDNTIILKPIKRFKAAKWQDYADIGEGIVDLYLKDKKTEKRKDDVCS
ncbi:MAG: AbrB/MazE/SpoVT family DNA-binding domain-containing protein [Candidatus Firestonebacteria bacterium]|nr:AbrB/MazE/SpoVT family DNA-binding domain-containing protein [Candidatus Firestonebacteria bacterium]